MSLSFACLYLCHLIFHHYMVVSAAPHCMDSIHVSMNHPWRNSSSSVPSKMHIGLIVVGTRGDLNPFLVLAKALVKKGHVVRLASHELYRDSIETTHGLEFGPLAGDPVVLSEFMVRTKGSIVSPASFHDRRKLSRVIREIMFSTWTAMTDDRFIPDAIIANPTNYGDTAIAEKLHIPPWVRTDKFAHPLVGQAGFHQADASPKWNRFSYQLVERFLYLGLRSSLAEFRRRLELDPKVSWKFFHRQQKKVPYSFLFSPNLVPQPHDWSSERVAIVGALNLPPVRKTDGYGYQPPLDLNAFLQASRVAKTKVIYIGFGSMVLTTRQKSNFVSKLTKALRRTTVSQFNVLLQSGWTKFDFEQDFGSLLRPNATFHHRLFIIGEAPHEWVFDQVDAVVHHGGAGTTAFALAKAKPSWILPFFGDQFFWANAIYRAQVGPRPCAIDALRTKTLIAGLLKLQDPALAKRVKQLARQMAQERPEERALESFYRQLPAWQTLELPAKPERNRTRREIIVWKEISHPHVCLAYDNQAF